MPPLSSPPFHINLRSIFFMRSSSHLLELFSRASINTSAFSDRLFHLHSHPFLSSLPRTNVSKLTSFSIKSLGYRSYTPLSSPGTVRLEPREGEAVREERLEKLRVKLAEIGIQCDSFKTGQYMHSLCPKIDQAASLPEDFKETVAVAPAEIVEEEEIIFGKNKGWKRKGMKGICSG